MYVLFTQLSYTFHFPLPPSTVHCPCMDVHIWVLTDERSPIQKIGEAFRRFGISDSTRNLLVVKVSTDPQVTQATVAQHLSTHVKGREIPFDDVTLRGLSDVERIRKVYKISLPPPHSSSGKNHKGGRDDVVTNGDKVTILDSTTFSSNLVRQVLGLMALRGAT